MTGHAYTAEALRQPRSPGQRREPPRASVALALAAATVLAMAITYLVASHLPAAKVRDAAALHDFTQLNRPAIEWFGNHLLHLLDPVLFALWGAALVCIALARDRPRLAVAVACVMTLAPLSAEVLKPLLAHPHVGLGEVRVGAASWPSGHATAALTLVLCALLVTPARWRRVAGWLGAAYALAVGLVLVILAWHMPSDVLGGYLMAILWTALAVAALRATDRRWPRKPEAPG